MELLQYGEVEMIITPQSCLHYIAENFKDNLNKTCELKGKCQLISDKASCSKYTYKADTGFWDKDGNYKENIEEISMEDE